MATLRVDRLLSKILEFPLFMSFDLADLRDRYLLLLGTKAAVSNEELSEYLLCELEGLKRKSLIQQYCDLPDDEFLFLVEESFYRVDKELIEGPFEKRIRIGLGHQDLRSLKSRADHHSAQLAVKLGEIDECLNLSREFPELAKSLKEKHSELVLEASTLEGRIQLIKDTLRGLPSRLGE